MAQSREPSVNTTFKQEDAAAAAAEAPTDDRVTLYGDRVVAPTEHAAATAAWTAAQRPHETGVIARGGPAAREQSRLAGVEVPMTHNNMMPFFGGSIRQSVKADANDRRLENYTGQCDLRRPKTELRAMGDIRENAGNVYGSSGMYQAEQERMQAGRLRQNELPFDQVRVGPGLARGYEADPVGGYQQFDVRDYAMPKDTNDLRVANKPKDTYKARIVEGMQVSLPSQTVGDMCKNRVNTYYENTPDRYFVTTGAVVAETSRAEQILKCPTRPATEGAYTGVARASTDATEQRPDARPSDKPGFVADSVRNAKIKDAGAGVADDYSRTSILVYSNERDYTACRTRNGTLTAAVKSIIAPLTDIARPSAKEYTVRPAREFGTALQAQMPSKLTQYDPNDVARTTIKETLIHDTHDGILSGPKRLAVYDPEDILRVTGRNTLDPEDTGLNLKGPAYKQTVYDPEDAARTTTKETTIDGVREGNIDGREREGGAYMTNEFDAKATQKQFTSDADHYGVVYVRDAKGGYKILKYKARATQKQFTSDADHVGVAKSAHDAPMSQEATDNAVIRDRQERLLKSRAPTRTGAKQAPNAAVVGDVVSSRAPCSDTAPRGLGNVDAVRNQIPGIDSLRLTQQPTLYKNDDRLDPSVLAGLMSNPYAIPMMR